MKRDLRLAIVLLSGVCLSLIFITSWKVVTARASALNNVNVNGLNLAQALVTYSEGVVRQSSMLLNGAVERLEAEGLGEQPLVRLGKLMQVQHGAMPQLSGFVVYDKQGDWLFSSSGVNLAGLNSADRVYFVHHQNDPSREVFIGVPIQSRSNKEWVITISRRLNDSAGGFAGVVAATLSVKNFLDLFGKIDVGDKGSISLASTSGRLLARYPFREQDMGRDFSQSPNYKKYFAGRSVGTAAFTSGFDGVERLSAFRQSDSLPLFVTVSREQGEALQAWRLEAQLSFAVLTVLMLLLAGSGLTLLKHIRGRIESERELLVARQQLLRTNEQLEQLASKDPLTGLANRRCFDEVLAMESRRAERSGAPLSLLMVDLDYFKLFNDSQGHVAGDQCLSRVSQMIEACIRRPADLAARYGGEELAVILADTDIDGAQAVATLILTRLAELNIAHGASPFGRVTTSIGIACFTGEALTRDGWSIVQAADSALYRAKALGRNQAQSFSEIVEVPC